MKNTPKPLCSICHDVIRTQHVFIESDQVYLKRGHQNLQPSDSEADQWFPINFQWIPIMRLNNDLNNNHTFLK